MSKTLVKCKASNNMLNQNIGKAFGVYNKIRLSKTAGFDEDHCKEQFTELADVQVKILQAIVNKDKVEAALHLQAAWILYNITAKYLNSFAAYTPLWVYRN